MPGTVRTREQRLADWKTIDRRRRALIRTVESRVKKRLSAEKRAVSKAVRKVSGNSIVLDAVNGALLNGIPAWRKLYLQGIYLPVGDSLATATFESVKGMAGEVERKQVPIDVTEVRPLWLDEIRAFAEGILGTEISNVLLTTRKQVARVVTAGIEAGQSIPQIAKGIEGIYDDSIIPKRSVMIARTETIRASNFGSQQGALATGLTLLKEWIATPGGRTRAWHAAADGQEVPIDDPFKVENGKGVTENLMFPADVSLGASADNVINCRCSEGYVPQGA